jgi:electron transfer flavoprotein beta subunit
VEGDKLKVGREIEGGNQEMNEISCPACCPSRPASTNRATWASAASARWPRWRFPTHGAADLGVAATTVGAAGAKVKRLDYFVPEMGEGAEMLEGSTEEIIAKLIELLKAKGGLK